MSYIYLFLLTASFAAIQCMIGGTRLLFSIPCYGMLALAGTLTLSSIRRQAAKPDLFCVASALILGGYLLIRSAYSPWPFLSKSDYYMVIGCLLVYLLVAYFVTKTTHRLIVVAGLLSLALADVLVGLVQFSKGRQFMLFGFIREGNDYRASGMFINPNHLAGYLEVVAIMAVSIAFWGRMKPALRMLVSYAALCCYIGIAICGSRGGYVSTLVSLLTFAILSAIASRRVARSKVIAITVLAILVSSALLFLAVSLMTNSNLIGSRLARISTDEVRHPMWLAAIDQFRKSPAIGTGAGTYLYYGRLFRRIQVQADPVHVHNDYLELLAEYGILGMIAMAVFLAAHTRRGLQNSRWLVYYRLRESPDCRSSVFALQTGALSGVAAYLAHSMVDFNMHIPSNAMLLSFLFGMVANPDIDGKEMPAEAENCSQWLRFALPILSLGFLISGAIQSLHFLRSGLSLSSGGAWTAAMILPQMPAEYWAEQTRVALRDQEPVKSLGLAKKAMLFDPQNPTLYFYEGEAYRNLAFRVLHRSSLETTYFKKALESYQQGLAIFPVDENLLVRMAQSLDGLNRVDEAEEAFQKAFAADPNLGIIHAYYGAHLRKLGRIKESDEHYKIANHLSSHNVSQIGLPELGNP